MFSRLSIDFLFLLIGLIGVDSGAVGKIAKSVVIKVLESVDNVLLRSEPCPVHVNGGNLFSLMSDDSGVSSSVTHILFSKVIFEV